MDGRTTARSKRFGRLTWRDCCPNSSQSSAVPQAVLGSRNIDRKDSRMDLQKLHEHLLELLSKTKTPEDFQKAKPWFNAASPDTRLFFVACWEALLRSDTQIAP